MQQFYFMTHGNKGFDAYKPITLKDVKRSFIERGEAALTALKEGDVRDGRRIGWLRVKDGEYGVKPGYGSNNAFVGCQGYTFGDYKTFDTPVEAQQAVASIIEAYQAGLFDDELKALFKKQKAMVAGRQKALDDYRELDRVANSSPKAGTVEFLPESVAAE